MVTRYSRDGFKGKGQAMFLYIITAFVKWLQKILFVVAGLPKGADKVLFEEDFSNVCKYIIGGVFTVESEAAAPEKERARVFETDFQISLSVGNGL